MSIGNSVIKFKKQEIKATVTRRGAIKAHYVGNGDYTCEEIENVQLMPWFKEFEQMYGEFIGVYDN